MLRAGHAKRRLFSRGKKPKEAGDVSLQITSMADIFTILLVFLLKGVASDAIQINPSAGTRLPAGMNAASLAEPALQIELSSAGISVEKEFIAPLELFHLPEKSLAQDGTLPALTQRLSKERERQKLIAQANDSVKIDSRVIILSDQKIPFSTMKPILRSLAAQGYSEVKFAVVNAEKE